jgi:hypothetical protein
MAQITLATKNDVPTLVAFLMEMAKETDEHDLSIAAVSLSVEESFSNGILWFLFTNEVDGSMGCCHCQSVYNYWRAEERYYMGEFYIKPEHRGKGKFNDLNKQLKNWFMGHNGVQLYTHIRKDDKVRIKAFESVGFEEKEYGLYMNHWGS